MNGHVFQLHTEQQRRGQFQATLDQLQTFTAIHHKKESKAMKVIFTNMEEPILPVPQLPAGKQPISRVEEALFAQETKQYVKNKENLEVAMVSISEIVWAQCSKILQDKLKTLPNFKSFDDVSNLVQLLKEIKMLNYKINDNISPYEALHDAKVKLYTYQQKYDETLAEHIRNFKDLVAVVDYYGGYQFYDKRMTEKEMEKDKEKGASLKTVAEYKKIVTDRAKAIALLRSACRKKYGRLMSNIRDQYAFKIDVYPSNITDAYDLLSTHYKHNIQSKGANKRTNIDTNTTTKDTPKEDITNNNTGVSYLQEEAVQGKDGRVVSHITCYSCGKKGHYSDNCPQGSPQQQHVQTTDVVVSGKDRDPINSDPEQEDQHLQINDNDEISDDESVVIHFQWA